MKRDGDSNPYRSPGTSPERSAEAAPERPYWMQVIGTFDGVVLAVIGLAVLNVTVAEPAGRANNAMVARALLGGLGIALIIGGGGRFALSLFRLLGGRRVGS